MLSQKARYALRALVELARADGVVGLRGYEWCGVDRHRRRRIMPFDERRHHPFQSGRERVGQFCFFDLSAAGWRVVECG